MAREDKRREIITAREAAARLGRGVDTVEQALRDGSFPVGAAYKNKSSGRWTYIIPRLAFERFMTGEIAGTRANKGLGGPVAAERM
jgi:hypothetical protein